MRANIVDVPFHEGTSYTLYTLADVHAGNANAQLDKVEALVDKVYRDPLGLLTINGDMGDYITYTDRRFDPATVDSRLFEDVADLKRLPQVYEEYLTALLEPVADKIICMTTGTHEQSIAKMFQDDPMWLVCRNLGLQHVWGDWACMTTLRFSDGNKHADSFDVFQSHGWQASRKGGAVVNNLDDMMGWILCDLLLQSHSHQYIVKHKVVLYADCGTIRQKVIVGAHCGGWLLTYKQVHGGEKTAASYAEKAGYPPTMIGSPSFKITPTRYGHGTVEG